MSQAVRLVSDWKAPARLVMLRASPPAGIVTAGNASVSVRVVVIGGARSWSESVVLDGEERGVATAHCDGATRAVHALRQRVDLAIVVGRHVDRQPHDVRGVGRDGVGAGLWGRPEGALCEHRAAVEVDALLALRVA